MKKNKGKIIKIIIVLVALIAVAGIGASIFLISRYSPTKERMSGYTYFDVEESTDNVLIILDDNVQQSEGVYVEDRLYVPYEFVANSINVRFYNDKESSAVLYSDTEHIYSHVIGSKSYTDEKGTSNTLDSALAIDNGGTLCLDWEYVATHTNLNYSIGSEPERLVIRTENYEDAVKNNIVNHSNAVKDDVTVSYVEAKKKAAVRYRGGIKSPILEDVDKDTQLIVLEDLEDWIKVITPTGITGYISSKDVSSKETYVWQDTWSPSYNRIALNAKVNLAWFQVGGTAGNAEIDSYLSGTSGINVISPTWYSITDSTGNMSCYASKDFVNKMHNRGLQVWALVDDFDKSVDFKALYSSKATRTKMVNRLVTDASKYGFEGINLDFENVKSDYAKDFLQFVRELSVACEEAGVILSTDNYKPAAYNSCYNLEEQKNFVDYVIIMAYDEHYSGSEAGSVASLPFVTEAINDTIKQVPKEQVVIGIPFFTRIWTISGGSTTSKAVGMQAAINQLNSDGQVAIWNDECGQYVVSYTSGSSTKQIWFEEEKSIEAKMNAIKEAGVAGVAEWKLGLEKASVWAIISQYLN